MHGHKTQPRRKARGYADGGMVTRDDEQKPAPAPSSGALPPEVLGTGAAANAGKALKGRQAQLDEALNFADGGTVRGPGTGTSDDIETQVPDGSYIMPADSTAQIGAPNLEAMGKGAPVDVNLSNGEQVMPPEQVHAVGVQALDQMKGATHTPAAEQGAAKGYKPEMFFADGGVVEDEARKRAAQAAYDPNPSIRSAQAGADAAEQQNAIAARNSQRAAQMSEQYNIPVTGPRGAASPVAASGYSSNEAVRNLQARDDQDMQNKAVAKAEPAATSPQQPGVGAIVAGGAKAIAGAATYPYAYVADKVRGGAAALAGGDPSTLPGGANKYSDAVGDFTKQGYDRSAAGVAGVQASARDALGVQAAKPAPATPAAVAPASPATAPAQPSSTALLPGADTGPSNLDAQAAAAAPVLAEMKAAKEGATGANNITREGNSFSGTNIGPGYTINGQPAPLPTGVRSAQNEQAVQNLFARTPELGAGPIAQAVGYQPQGPAVIGIAEPDRSRQRLINAASTGYKGAQNGQLTAAQLGTLRSIDENDNRNATTRYTNDQNNATAMTTAGMREDGANMRTAVQETGANQRFSASNQLDQRRVNGEEQSRGYQQRALDRQEKLYEQYDKAKPEERAAIAQQIRDLSGKADSQQSLSSNFMRRKVPALNAEGQVVGEQEEIVDLRTGQPINAGGTKSQPARPVGTRSTVNGKTAVWDGKQWIPQ